jgi:PHD/YefM family antitoxin component YafN of YafNO toxin-antitoxin module
VCDAKQHEDDETAYLLKSSANRERLLKAIENVTQNRRLITVTLDELRRREILGEWENETR